MYGLDRSGHARIRHALPDRPATGRARRAVRAAVPRRPALGHAHRHPQRRCRRSASRTDKPAAALVTDLKQRGLLDTTIVHWGGEIGRLPRDRKQGDAPSAGRDHNGQGFSIWLAGGGFQRRHDLRRDRRSSATAPSKTSSPPTTSRPRSCTSSAWTTSSSSICTTAASNRSRPAARPAWSRDHQGLAARAFALLASRSTSDSTIAPA